MFSTYDSHNVSAPLAFGRSGFLAVGYSGLVSDWDRELLNAGSVAGKHYSGPCWPLGEPLSVHIESFLSRQFAPAISTREQLSLLSQTNRSHIHRKMAIRESLLLQLPDSCLLVVLQHTAAQDQRSLFSAARAHSRLKQVAEVVLRINSATVTEQQQVHSIQVYLQQHSQRVDSMTLLGEAEAYGRPLPVTVVQLPPGLQLSSLQLLGVKVQLQPGGGFRGLLGAAAGTRSLKQLQLTRCRLVDGQAGLAAALAQLPTLEHLSLVQPSSAPL